MTDNMLDLTNCQKRIINLATQEIVDLKTKAKKQRTEIEELEVKLKVMRGVANSYKRHYEKAQAEIERLSKENIGLKYDLQVASEESLCVRENAIKEFAERLKAEFEPEPNFHKVANFTIKLFRNTIDNLVKEMAGD